jgi:uncharacterized protein
MTISAGEANGRVSFRLAAGIGLAAGLLGGLFGVGGGLIIVPSLLAFASMDRRRAHGTSLGSTLLIGLASLATYLTHGNVDWAVAAFLAAGSVVGAVIGTTLLHVVSKRVLVYVFVATVLVTALRLFTTTESDGIEHLTPWTAALMVVVGLVAGVLAGLLGIGGGVIMVPAVVMVLGLPPAVAKGTSAAVIVPTALIGTIRNRTNQNADIRVAVVVGLFGAATAVLGALISDRLSDSLSNVLFALLLIAVAITQLMSLRLLDESAPPSSDITRAAARSVQSARLAGAPASGPQAESDTGSAGRIEP